MIRVKKYKKKIACFGFSANPPHKGHLFAVRDVLTHTDVDEVWLIPCGNHSFGKDLMPRRDRWAMTKLVARARVKAVDIELKRKGISYTIDTIGALRRAYPDYQFSWIIGSDIVASKSYTRWKSWHELCTKIRFFVIRRPGYPLREGALLPCFEIVKGGATRRRNISSTMIRKRLARGRTIKKLVPPRIETYLKKLEGNI